MTPSSLRIRARKLRRRRRVPARRRMPPEADRALRAVEDAGGNFWQHPLEQPDALAQRNRGPGGRMLTQVAHCVVERCAVDAGGGRGVFSGVVSLDARAALVQARARRTASSSASRRSSRSTSPRSR